jgi:hypothetical protein
MLPGQLSKKYLDAHFPVERRRLAEARISDMVEKIKTVFQARLLKTTWMDPETRRIQAEKIGSIVARVVEPLHGHWEEEQLDMDPLRYIKNLNAVQTLRVQRNFKGKAPVFTLHLLFRIFFKQNALPFRQCGQRAGMALLATLGAEMQSPPLEIPCPLSMHGTIQTGT